jgi:hypothetical protein
MLSLPNEQKQELKIIAKSIMNREYNAEIFTFHRLVYKNKNQHRKSRHFQRILLLKRIFKRIDVLDISVCLSTIYGCADTTISIDKVVYSLENMRKCHQLNVLLIQEIPKTYKLIRDQVSATLFMPVNLTFMACLSKLYALVTRINQDLLSDAYTLVLDLLPEKERVKLPNHVDGTMSFKPQDANHGEKKQNDKKEKKNKKSRVDQDLLEIMQLSNDFFS